MVDDIKVKHPSISYELNERPGFIPYEFAPPQSLERNESTTTKQGRNHHKYAKDKHHCKALKDKHHCTTAKHIQQTS